MQGFSQKNYIKITLLITLFTVIGLVVLFTQPALLVHYPENDTILTAEDFIVRSDTGEVTVGLSSWDQVIEVFPEGENLGKSTVYRPLSDNCLLQFTKNENILDKMHIYGDYLTTSRGIKIGDSFADVEARYGSDYTKMTQADRPGYFEAIYGCDDNNDIIFKVQDQKIVKIILQRGISRE